MKQKNRGQISLEYIIVTSLVLISFALFGIVIFEKYSQWADLKTHMTIKKIGKTLAENINQISIVGDGYSKEFTLLQGYSGEEFNVTFKRPEPMVFVEARDMTSYNALLTYDIYCCLDACETVDDYTIMHLNSTLESRIINREGSIYIGGIC